MKLIRNIASMIPIILAMSGIGLFPNPMSAQDRAGGEFKLSREVHWGSSVLPSGEYTYSVNSASGPPVVRVRQKDGGFSGAFLPQAFLRGNYSGPSGIVLERIGEETFVTSLRIQGIGAVRDFSIPGVKEEIPPSQTTQVEQGTDFSPSEREFFTILSPNHQRVASTKVEKVYLAVCQAVEREFNRAEPVRPRLTLVLGATKSIVRFPNREIRLKKWDEYEFADAVLDVAMHDLISTDVRLRLIHLISSQARATVDICELKNCTN